MIFLLLLGAVRHEALEKYVEETIIPIFNILPPPTLLLTEFKEVDEG